jgi:hypothetical protein
MKFFYPIIVALLLLGCLNAYAQESAYEDRVFRPEIKSVEFYNTAKEASFPIIVLNSGQKLLLAFDNLRGGTENYTYTIEHCDANWNSSNLSPIDYLTGENNDQLTDYSYSTTTLQKYTHYRLRLPNEHIAPKIPGNYILKVYEDGDQSKMVLTRRFYVVNPKIAITADIVPSSDNSLRGTDQKINFTLDYGTLPVQNPGGDTRSLKLNSERILHIYKDTANTVLLLTDPDRSQPDYTFFYDLNGSFYILNQDGTDPRTDADYVHMYFTLSTKRSPDDGTPYLVGKFNDYRLDDDSRMRFDAASGKFAVSQFLKQGVYDYTYVWVDKSGKADIYALEGSHFETENDYQILVYYRPPQARWEELIGYQTLNSAKK